LGEESGPKNFGRKKVGLDRKKLVWARDLGRKNFGRENVVWAEKNEVWARDLGRKISGGKILSGPRKMRSGRRTWAEKFRAEKKKRWSGPKKDGLGEEPGPKNFGRKKDGLGRKKTVWAKNLGRKISGGKKKEFWAERGGLGGKPGRKTRAENSGRKSEEVLGGK
jgi:hypothetical protein